MGYLRGRQRCSKSNFRLGGMRAKSLESQRQAGDRAEALRGVMTELADMSANQAAKVLNERGIATPEGGRWHAMQVIRVRKRLAVA